MRIWKLFHDAASLHAVSHCNKTLVLDLLYHPCRPGARLAVVVPVACSAHTYQFWRRVLRVVVLVRRLQVHGIHVACPPAHALRELRDAAMLAYPPGPLFAFPGELRPVARVAASTLHASITFPARHRSTACSTT
ncbi:MAG: hypothetical protein H0V70_09910 [Ktedonobacteraceae bacterium]|nr:hypothetical protein [Ktedonobacteraceae bacterium]